LHFYDGGGGKRARACARAKSHTRRKFCNREKELIFFCRVPR
jgi:hypothetical protein